MISDKMVTQFNEQINKELYSSYLYLQMAAFFQDINLPGLASWMKVQAQEEIAHAMIFFNYVGERGGKVVLGAIGKPEADFQSPLDVFKATLAHERKVTASINALMDLAMAERDYASRNRLEWFISEQVEEEAGATEIVAKLELIGDKGGGLFMLDKELGARTFVPPAPLVGA